MQDPQESLQGQLDEQEIFQAHFQEELEESDVSRQKELLKQDIKLLQKCWKKIRISLVMLKIDGYDPKKIGELDNDNIIVMFFSLQHHENQIMLPIGT